MPSRPSGRLVYRFSAPRDEEYGGRLCSVLHTLYLIFSEGYTSSGGAELQRLELSREAIRLARILRAQAPEEAETAGLLALMLLTDARRLARTTRDGALIPLDRQDRALWDQGQIEEGIALLESALRKGVVGPYQLQAAIAAVHDEAARVENTDWPQILALYDLLKRMSDNPVIALNHAIAAAMVHGPARGLELLTALDADTRVAGHHRLPAVRGHLYELAGDYQAAIDHYRIAALRTTNIPERDYLISQAARLVERSAIR